MMVDPKELMSPLACRLVALCCGVTVGNLYAAHPILPLLGRAFDVLFFLLVPLGGDRIRRRRLMAALFGVAAFARRLPRS